MLWSTGRLSNTHHCFVLTGENRLRKKKGPHHSLIEHVTLAGLKLNKCQIMLEKLQERHKTTWGLNLQSGRNAARLLEAVQLGALHASNYWTYRDVEAFSACWEPLLREVMGNLHTVRNQRWGIPHVAGKSALFLVAWSRQCKDKSHMLRGGKLDVWAH